MKRFSTICLSAVAAISMMSVPDAEACTRVLYVGDTTAVGAEPLRIVGRSLDWKTPIPTNLYIYPRGIEKVGNVTPDAVKWKSKYGAVYAVGYDGGVTEGMNEKGLVINGLFCKGTVYNNPDTEGRPAMSLAVFVAWLLDMNATTPEVVDVLKRHDFTISGATFDGGTVSALHWGVTDAQGRAAVIEFDKGVIRVYEGQDIPVLTNDPTFPSMNAINDYWIGVGGAHMLPGTVKSPDRFVRAYYFNNHVKKTADPALGLSICRSVLMNASVPYQYTVETEPNVSSTQWRSFADINNLRYYFDIVTNLGVYYVNLNEVDLSEGAPVLKLDTSHSSEMVGDVTRQMNVSQPFTPMY